MRISGFAGLWAGQTALTASFQHREYRALWSAAALSAVAQGTLFTGRSAVAFQSSGGSIAVGIVVFATMLPSVFMPPFGGVIADRFNRRTVSTCTLAIALLSALIMAFLTITDQVNVWHLFVLSLVNGAARAVEMPATQAMVPAMVKEERLLNAVALMGVVTHGSRLMGPLVTLIVLGPFGVGGAFIAAGLFYGFALLLIQKVPRPFQYRHPAGESPLRQFADGARYAAREPIVGLFLIMVLAHCLFTMHYDALMPRYAQEQFGAGGRAFSLLLIAIGVGSLGGTLVLAGVSARWHRGKMFFYSGIISGLAPALLALSPGWPVTVVGAAAMGASHALFLSLAQTFLQTATPDRYRGRVLSYNHMLGGGIMAFSNLGSGWASDQYGVAVALGAPAAVFALIMLLTMLGGTLRGVYRRGALPVLTPAPAVAGD